MTEDMTYHLHAAQTALDDAWDVVHYAVEDDRGIQRGRRSVWYLSNHDAEELAKVEASAVIGYGARRCISALIQLNEARDLLTTMSRESVHE
jgi:hypothetical protein